MCVLLANHAVTRAQLLPIALFLQPTRALLHCRVAFHATLLPDYSFFVLGSLSVVYLEFARLDTSQGLGHIASESPNRTIISLAKWEANKEEEDQQEVVEEVDEGELLVLRRAMSNLKGEKEEQRENIFHSRYTIQGKVCSLIIDGGSCANVASSSMVGKLGPRFTPPYNILWLNQGKGLQLNSRCLISLFVGKNYQDELWCDTIPMDACHILLGRP